MWPSFLGGADTKLAHLLVLLKDDFRITVVPNDPDYLKNAYWTDYLTKLGIAYCTINDLPEKLEGFGLALSNQCFFTHSIAERAKAKGLKVIWSPEMMWHHRGESEAIKEGLVDKILYVSEVQKKALQPGHGNIPWEMTGNYIDPSYFPFQRTDRTDFAIGRLSRADPKKYPEDFPVFYEALGLPRTRFRVMAWSEDLANKYRWHSFDDRWDLLVAEKESQLNFLLSLDLFVYPLGHTFTESWGRSTVEAMLTGCIPLVPRGHNFENLIIHEFSGFLCDDFLEYQEYAHQLYRNFKFRQEISNNCAKDARERLCNREEHLTVWKKVFQ